MNELERLQKENEALTLALQAQREINHYKQFFLARVAHELRSPLSSLISLQQLILHDLCETPAEEKEFLSDANVAAQKLLTMIDDLVTVSDAAFAVVTSVVNPMRPFANSSTPCFVIIDPRATILLIDALDFNFSRPRSVTLVPLTATSWIFGN